jgi:type I restriction enzyme, S subunit
MIKTTKYKLKDIAEVSAGDSAPSKDDFSSDGIPFIRASSLDFLTNKGLIEKCEKIDKQLASRNNLRLFPKHSVIFAKSGMSAKMGRVYELATDSYVVSHLAVLQAKSNLVNPSFLKYYFSYKPPFHLIRDDAYPSIRLSDIGLIEVDLPDMITQNKIVAVLDKASSLVRKREDTIELFAELLKAIFLETFGDPITNPKNWETEILEGIATLERGRFSPRPRNDPSYFDGEYPFIQTGVIVY